MLSPRRFRNSFTSPAGVGSATILQGRVVDLNLVNWTVDVYSTFDRHYFYDVQIGTPYLHFNNGEGIFVMPEIGAVCHICIPGDSSPPYVLDFIMPSEVTDGATDDAPLGVRSRGAPQKQTSDASFAGGRPRLKPGDIYLRTRDGNFIILHRGGVLSIGANEVAQRVYIPLGNHILDVSERYTQHAAGGSVVWGLQEGPSLTRYPAQKVETFRVYANDQYADIKLARGYVYNPVPEPDGGQDQADAGVGAGEDNPILLELTVSPKGFIAESGDNASAATPKNSVLRYVFDRKGNTFLRSEGSVAVRVRKKLTLRVTESFVFATDDAGTITAKNGLTIDGGDQVHIKGDIIKLGAGAELPVVRKGEPTQMNLLKAKVIIEPTAPLTIPGTPVPCFITTLEPLISLNEGGNPFVLA